MTDGGVTADAVQLFEVSTAYQVMVLAAAIDSGAFAPAPRRILLVTVNTPVPEVGRPADAVPGIAPLLSRFDAVVSLNDLVAPLHPTDFRPRKPEQPLFERLFRTALGIAEHAPIELVVESVQAPPARTLINVFAGAAVTVYAEGLMSYGPTRTPLPPDAGSRIERVLHLDLIEGLAPLLLQEYGVRTEAVDGAAFLAVVAEVAAAAPPAAPREPYALVLGQYLAQLGLLTAKAEAAMVADLVAAAARRGFTTVAVKPHPSAPPDALAPAAQRATELGVRLVILQDPAPAETFYATDPPGLVLGCFSTGLVTAARYWSIPALTMGTDAVLAALPRFEDSNRIPLAIVARAIPAVGDAGFRPPAVAELQRIVATVGYCMQWRTRAPWRADAERALREQPELFTLTVPRARRRRLALPGGWPLALAPHTFHRAALTLTLARSAQLAAVRRLRRSA